MAVARTNDCEQTVTVGITSEFSGLHLIPEGEAWHGAAVRGSRVLAVPGKVLVRLEAPDESTLGLLVQAASAECDDLFGLSGGEGFGDAQRVGVKFFRDAKLLSFDASSLPNAKGYPRTFRVDARVDNLSQMICETTNIFAKDV